MKPLIIIADTAFLSKKVLTSNNFLSIFPMREGDGAYRFTSEELVNCSKLQSNFYDSISLDLINNLSNIVNLKSEEFNLLFRPVLVRITITLLDHYIRINHRLNSLNDHKNIKVLEVDNIETVNSHSFFENSSASWHFNQLIIMKIMNSIGYSSKRIITKEEYPEFPNLYPMRNFLFAPYGSLGLDMIRKFNTIKGLIIQSIGRLINYKSKFLCLGFSSDEYYMNNRGLYGPLSPFLRIQHKAPKIIIPMKDENLRNEFKKQLTLVVKNSLPILLKKINLNFSTKYSDSFINVWINLMTNWFPTYALEGILINLNKQEKLFKNKNITAIIGENATLFNSDLGFIRSVKAKIEKKKIIGLQHSAGHYGYIEDLTSCGQYELSHLDSMVTFGWNKIESYFPQTKFISLPCPKLSEKPLKSDYLSKREISKKNKVDILFLSNTFHRFVGIGTSGQSRVDFIDQITSSQKQLIQSLTDANLTINHKPFNMRFVDLYPKHYEELSNVGNDKYKLIDYRQKGLTINFIKTAKIILWDQIGSGTVECFVAEIPTIIYWKRIYSREAKWAKSLVDELEKCGVVSSDPAMIAYQINDYLNDPIKWMNETKRVNAIKNFCNVFANTDPNWSNIWKKYFKDLGKKLLI